MSELPAPHTWKAPAHDPLCRQQHWEGGDCFDCRLIAKVRDHQRGLDIRQQVEEREAFRNRVAEGLADWGWENRDIEAVLSLFVWNSNPTPSSSKTGSSDDQA